MEKNEKVIAKYLRQIPQISLTGHFEYGNQVHVCNANRVDVSNAIVLEESTNSIEDDLGSYTSNVIYKFTCQRCSALYLGETT